MKNNGRQGRERNNRQRNNRKRPPFKQQKTQYSVFGKNRAIPEHYRHRRQSLFAVAHVLGLNETAETENVPLPQEDDHAEPLVIMVPSLKLPAQSHSYLRLKAKTSLP